MRRKKNLSTYCTYFKTSGELFPKGSATWMPYQQSTTRMFFLKKSILSLSIQFKKKINVFFSFSWLRYSFCTCTSVLHMWEDGSEELSGKCKFLCCSHSCTMTLQMAVLPFVQPPGISPNHNGITSERQTGKSDFIICHSGNISERREGGTGPLAPLSCHPAFYYWKHTHTAVFK